MALRRTLQRLRKVSSEVVVVMKLWSQEKTVFQERRNNPVSNAAERSE